MLNKKGKLTASSSSRYAIRRSRSALSHASCLSRLRAFAASAYIFGFRLGGCSFPQRSAENMKQFIFSYWKCMIYGT